MNLHEALSSFAEFAGKVHYLETPGDLQPGFTVVYDQAAQNVDEHETYSDVGKTIVLNFWHLTEPGSNSYVALANLANKVCSQLGDLITQDDMGHQWPLANAVRFEPPQKPTRNKGAWFTSARGRINVLWKEE